MKTLAWWCSWDMIFRHISSTNALSAYVWASQRLKNELLQLHVNINLMNCSKMVLNLITAFEWKIKLYHKNHGFIIQVLIPPCPACFGLYSQSRGSSDKGSSPLDFWASSFFVIWVYSKSVQNIIQNIWERKILKRCWKSV